MKVRAVTRILLAAALAGSVSSRVLADCEKREIDASHSTMRVHVGKSGFLSAFGHDHEVEAPVAEGAVKSCETAAVELRVDATKLRVLDPGEKEETRAEIQKTMLGPEVLDSTRFREIRFVSSNVEPSGGGRWTVHGSLTLHGQTRPLKLDVSLVEGRYRGTATVRQTDFGITPVTVGGGTVKVKNEVKIEFQIAVAEKAAPKAELPDGGARPHARPGVTDR